MPPAVCVGVGEMVDERVGWMQVLGPVSVMVFVAQPTGHLVGHGIVSVTVGVVRQLGSTPGSVVVVYMRQRGRMQRVLAGGGQ